MTTSGNSKIHANDRLVLLVVIFIFFVLPLSTCAMFREEIQLDILTVVAWLLAISIGMASIFVILLRHVPPFVATILECALVLVALFFAYNFYLGDYGGKVIGADADVFSENYSSFELFSFAVVIGLFSFFYRKLKAHFQTVIILLILLSLANFAPLFGANEQAKKTKPPNPLLNSELLAFSTESNVFHIILDGMQGTLFSKMLESEEIIKKKFTGFTFFPDTSTSSEVTYLSLPATFSGRAWDGIGSIRDFRMKSGMMPLSNNKETVAASFLQELSQARYQVQVLSPPGIGMEKMSYYDEYFQTEFEDDERPPTDYFRRLLDLTLIKVMPWQGKRFVYNDGDWLFSRNTGEILPRAHRAVNFIDHYASEITRNSTRPTYKLIHLLTPHPPWTTGENCAVVTTGATIYKQAECIMLALGRLMDRLKAMGLYDRSLIVIHGDHGSCLPLGLPGAKQENLNIPKCFGNGNPLFMIKRPLDSAEFQISTNSVELTDIAPTILNLLAIEHHYKGIDVFDKEKSRLRTRYFYQFSPNRVVATKQDKVDEVLRYEISGPVWDTKSWCKTLSGDCSAN